VSQWHMADVCDVSYLTRDLLPTCQPVMMPSASSRPPHPDSVPRIKAGATLPGYSCTARSICMCREHRKDTSRRWVVSHVLAAKLLPRLLLWHAALVVANVLITTTTCTGIEWKHAQV
jgi:hypothetical protein